MVFDRELEKQIVELEKEKCELLGIIQGKDKAIKDLEWQLKEVLEDNDNYQKENATLKKQLEALSGDIHWNELKDVSEVTKELAEAREIIKGLLSCARNYPEGNLEKMQRAEQFLSEVEK